MPSAISDICVSLAQSRKLKLHFISVVAYCSVSSPNYLAHRRAQITYPQLPPSQPRWIDRHRRLIPHIPIQIRIGRGEPHRIFTDPCSCLRIVPSIEIVLESRVGVEGPPGEAEQRADVRISLPAHLPKRVVNDVVDDGCDICFGIVIGQVADGVEMVGERPEDLSAAVRLDLLIG